MNIAIAIKSSHQHHARRLAIEQTWLHGIDRYGVDWFYVIGNPRLVIPNALMCDVSDAFENIAPKIWCACMSAFDNSADLLFVCDDDTYVHLPRLLAAAPKQGTGYVGFMRTWGLDYNAGLPYAQGSAYWLDRTAIEHIVRSQKEMRPGIIDDGCVGQVLDGKVTFAHDRRYYPGPDPWLCPVHPDNNIITTHKCDPAAMRRMHKPFAGASRG